ncbi:hypothetical protein DUI87_34392 [Hirundo rustica rustica]|uniref:Uncharacterized protein n=1 Tax=Hirundo rustica rustica TaxID=333673 RepID=A0A3M0ILF9_HIRRU|nr:hypothetical protein DUI87_34392 [Hirundo rustica rustica]
MEIKAPSQGLRLRPLYKAPLKEKRREEKRREEKRREEKREREEKRREEEREKRREEKRRERERREEKRREEKSSSWSSQVCEVYALYQVLELLKDKMETLFTESKYAFGIVHTIRKIWQERDLKRVECDLDSLPGKGKELRESKESVGEKKPKSNIRGQDEINPYPCHEKDADPSCWWQPNRLVERKGTLYWTPTHNYYLESKSGLGRVMHPVLSTIRYGQVFISTTVANTRVTAKYYAQEKLQKCTESGQEF